MSLLTSLLQASTRFQQAMDNRTSRTEVSASESNESSATGEAPNSNDDRFTPSQWQEGNPTSQKTRQLPLTQYKQTVAQDLSYVRETLRHKLAEYNIHPATAVSVSKTEQGSIQLDGKIPDQVQEKIEQDLNNNRGFGEALSRLSVTEPTLHFMDNALKLNQAYGVNNPLLDSLVSENQQFNGLQDVIHRFDSLRRTVTPTDTATEEQQRYAFSFNARA